MDRQTSAEDVALGTAGRRTFLGRAAVGGIAAAAALVPVVGAAGPASATTQPSVDPVCTAASIAKLKQVNHNRYSSVAVAGYYAPGDRGGGMYHYDPADHHTADNGGTVIVGNGGARWKLAYTGPLSLRQFGAKGDGTADDTAAIRRWLAAIPEGGAAYAAAGKYRFTQPLVAPVRNRIAITGDGAQQTVFVYGGSSTTIDLLTIGDGTTSLSGWALEGFSINSTTAMTGGTALRLKKLQNGNHLTDVSFSALNAPKKLWDGIWFDNVNVLTYDHFEIDVQNEGLIVNGVAGADAGSDLTLDKGTITFPKVGIHVAGGFGGLYVGQMLVYGALVDGYLQDNGRVARGNRELVLSDFLVLDAAHANTLHINDPLSQNAVVQISAFISGAGWIAPASPGDGIFIETLPGGRVSIDSAQIKSSVRHGIRIADSTTLVRIASTTFITDSGGWGIFADVPTPNVHFDGAALYNGLGALSPNLSPDAVPTISGTLRNDYTGDLGTRFTTGANPVTVTKLGRWVVAGSSDTHTVRILDASTLAVVASAVIDASGGGVGFRYTALAGTATLDANTSYVLVSSETSGGDKWYHSSTMVTPGPVGTVDYAVYSTGSGFAADSSQANTSFVPPNFAYTGSSGELPFLLNS
jgi:hypothetical protein